MESATMTLSVRPAQLSDESLAGYLLRLSIRNGFSKANDWLNDRLVHNVECYCISKLQKRHLGNSIGIPFTVSPICLTSNLSPLFISPVFTSPRFCPLCLHENPYFKQVWQHAGNLYCDKHMCMLEDTCHSCQTPFKWQSALFENKCTSPDCVNSIREIAVSEYISSLGSKEVFDCYLADIFLQFPDTSLLHKTRNPSFNSLSEKVSRGLTLLSNKAQITKWFEKSLALAKLKTAYPKDLSFYSTELLLTNLQCEWPIKNILPKLLEDTPLDNMACTATITPIEITSQVLSKKLGLSTIHFKEVIALVEPSYKHKKIISPIHPINVGDIFNYLLEYKKPISNAITLYDAAKNNEEQRAKLFKAVFSNTIDFDYYPQEDILRSILLPSTT